MRVLGIIPARAGSKRVPRKNVRLLAGKSLVARSIEACLGARTLTKTVVSSDDEDALRIAEGYPEIIALSRPSEIATDEAPALEYVKHALGVMERPGDARYDAIAIVQPSSPFTMPEDIDGCVALLHTAGSADSVVSVVEVDQFVHPLKLKRLDGVRLVPLIEDERGRMAAHELPKVYVRNGSVYASRRSTIDGGSIVGDKSYAYIMPRTRSLDINDELDWRFAEFMVAEASLGKDKRT